MVVQQVESLRLVTLLRGPEHVGVLDAVLGKELAGSGCSIEFVAIVDEHLGSVEHFHLLLCTTR